MTDRTTIRDTFASLGAKFSDGPRAAQRRAVTKMLAREAVPWISFIEAPTGIGKSALAVAYGELKGATPLVICTDTISLQEQYARDFDDILVLKGRGNFTCTRNGMTADMGSCRVNSNLKCDSDYYTMRDALPHARRVVSNYSLFLSELMWKGQPPVSPGLLVCDEGHNLLDVLTRLETVQLSVRTVQRAGLDADGWDNLEDARAWAKARIEDAAAGFRHAVEMRRKQAARNWQALFHQCQAMLLAKDDYVVLSEGEDFRAAPLWPHEGARRLFSTAREVIVMSATLYGIRPLASWLGLEKHEYLGYKIDSPFQADRWPVYFRPAGYPSHNNKNEWPKIAEKVHSYVHGHQDVKGLVHVSSGKQVRKVMREALSCEECRTRLVLPDVKVRREKTIQQFKESPPGTWMCHYSAGQGEDFKDDMCRIQLIAKVPYLDLSDRLVKRRMNDGEAGEMFYNASTAAKLAQICGRGMRHESDYCETYILDGNFRYLYKDAESLFPSWFREILASSKARNSRSNGQ